MTQDKFESLPRWAQMAKVRAVLSQSYKPEGVEIIMGHPLKMGSGRSGTGMVESGDGWILYLWAEGLTSGAMG